MARWPEPTKSKFASASSFNRHRPSQRQYWPSRQAMLTPNPIRNNASQTADSCSQSNSLVTSTRSRTQPAIGNPRHLIDGDSIEGGATGSIVNEVIMAIDVRDRGTIGCAYFNTVDSVLSLSDDMPTATMDVVEQLLLHIEPTTLLVSGRAPEELLDFLQQRSHGIGQGVDITAPVLRALPSSDFSSIFAREKLLSFKLDASKSASAVISTGSDNPPNVGGLYSVSGNAALEESHLIKMIRYGTYINLDAHVSVNCAGAVLADLHRRRSVGFLLDGQKPDAVFHVQSLKTFSLPDCMLISSETLQSLQIIRSEFHPNCQSWGNDPGNSGTKQSLSVYGLFHLLAFTPQGRHTLRKMFLQPSLNIDLIKERQETISLFLSPTKAEILKQAGAVLRRVRNAKIAVSQLKRGIDSPSADRSFDRGVWAILRGFAAQALRLREIVGRIPEREMVETTRKVVNSIQPAKLVIVGDMINKTIDFEQSRSRHRPSVKVGIDTHLDELKRRYDGMGDFLTEVVNDISRRLPEWASQYIRSCIFLPQLGFLTVVEPDPDTGRGRYEGEGSNSGQWERLFTADGAACYKNDFMNELDEQYGDMYCEIGDREVEVIYDLARQVLRHADAIVVASEVCGSFDALLALSRGAEKYNLVCPQVTEGRALQIEGGRHPLQELLVGSFVPNDCHLGEIECLTQNTSQKSPVALAVTGPNHSGKSIYLKQTAIIVYLAHVGSFVPAAHATIGLTDRILTRISTKESVSRNESAFAIDLRQISQAMKSATPRSLVLVDEFGKGTNADNGAGLLAAALDYFLAHGSGSPLLLVATHFYEVFEGRRRSEYKGLGTAHMDVRANWDAGQPNNQITYLFKLCDGHNSSSFGGRCAALNGVPTAIVERAEAILLLLSQNEDLSFACARLSGQEERRLVEAEIVARRFLQSDFEEAVPKSNTGGELGPVLAEILRPASQD